MRNLEATIQNGFLNPQTNSVRKWTRRRTRKKHLLQEDHSFYQRRTGRNEIITISNVDLKDPLKPTSWNKDALGMQAQDYFFPSHFE